MRVDYSVRAANYDRFRADESSDREFWLPGLIEVGRIRPGDRVLDLGAGTGRFAKLFSATCPVVALDPSREMLQVAREKGPLACVRGDGHRLPFRDDAFDVTIAVMVLHHLADYRAALHDVARVSGRLVLATSDMTTRRLGILEEAFPSLLAIDRSRFPSIPGIRAALTAAGFGGIRIEERRYVRRLTTKEQIDRVRGKYLSTFDLLPAGEYERGLRFLEAELPRRYGDQFDVTANFTFLAGTR